MRCTDARAQLLLSPCEDEPRWRKTGTATYPTRCERKKVRITSPVGNPPIWSPALAASRRTRISLCGMAVADHTAEGRVAVGTAAAPAALSGVGTA
jgi:hypothetical protein